MKRCLVCNTAFAGTLENCPCCGLAPLIVDGFPAYAPHLAHAGGGFKSDYFSELVDLEEKNFWFLSRNQLIIWALKKYCPDFESLLEIGCGTGYVLSGIANAFPNTKLNASEIFTAGLNFAAARQPSINFMQMDATNIPFFEEFDVIGAFDVLEHIEDDRRVISQIYDALKPGGHIVLTVPQHQWLWSPVDEYACHVRRYRARDFHRIIEGAGFRISRSTSFVAALLPAMAISRLFQKKNASVGLDQKAELEVHPALNYLFSRILKFEIQAIKAGVDFAAGGSRLVIAKK